MSRPVVLLHGGWGGGWEWRGVAEALAGHGLDVHRPSLTGLGDRRHLVRPDIGLESHIDDVLVLLDAEQLHDVVLVGQSYSGMVISSVVARCDAVSSLVYLDGFVPDDGECLLDLVPQPVADGLRMLAAEGDGWRVPVPFTAADDDPPEVKAYASRANVAMPLRCFTDPVFDPHARRAAHHLRALYADPGSRHDEGVSVACSKSRLVDGRTRRTPRRPLSRANCGRSGDRRQHRLTHLADDR